MNNTMKGIFCMCLTLSALGLTGMLGAAELKVEKLGEDLWRVRMKRDGAERWPESGMNRYGVFADLPALETSASLGGLKVKPGRTKGLTPLVEWRVVE